MEMTLMELPDNAVMIALRGRLDTPGVDAIEAKFAAAAKKKNALVDLSGELWSFDGNPMFFSSARPLADHRLQDDPARPGTGQRHADNGRHPDHPCRRMNRARAAPAVSRPPPAHHAAECRPEGPEEAGVVATARQNRCGPRRALSLTLTTRAALGPGQGAQDFLQRHGIGERGLYDAALVLEELFINIVSYGFSDAVPHQIGVVTRVSDRHFL
jgi:hypothetical protein